MRTHLNKITSRNLHVAVSVRIIPFLQSASNRYRIFGVLVRIVHALFHPSALSDYHPEMRPTSLL